MRILLTNDDGIHAEGLKSLYAILSPFYEVYVIAPDTERSACSNAITIGRDLQIIEVDKNCYSLNGFPADCVNIAVNGDIIPDIDLVISGINHGPNLGDDLFFSGTVAGARTAFIFGKTGIAVSMDSYHRVSQHFDEASQFVHEFIESNRDGFEHSLRFYNINYPDLPREKVSGVKETYAGRRIYTDTYTRNNPHGDNITLQLNGEISSVHLKGSDATSLKEGFISITPLKLDCTDYGLLKNR